MESPYFSIIIPALNEEKNLPILLSCLTRSTYRYFEVIVCDGGSIDRTKTIALSFKSKFASFSIDTIKVKNVAASRNYGFLKSRGKYLVFLDSDVKVENNFLAIIENHLRIDKLDALTLWNRPENSKLTNILIFGILNFMLSLFQKIKPGANGPCIIMSKDLFKKINGFDETIVFGEDFDLIQRASKEKIRFKVYASPKLFVSTRRFEKEGFLLSLIKSTKALLHQLIFGPIRRPIFDYEMGGQYYKSDSKK